MIGFQPKAKKKSAASAESAQSPKLGFPGNGPQSPAQAQALNQAPDSIPGMFKPGEFVLPPDTVHAMGGKEALSQVVQATHTPAPADAVVPRGFKPEVFFSTGGAPEDKLKKNSFGDAAAASLDNQVNQIPTGGTKAPEPTNVTQAQATPATATAREQLISQIPGNGAAPSSASTPDSRSNPLDTELGRNVSNTIMALPGVGGIVPRVGGSVAQAASRALSTERVLPAAWEVVQGGGALTKSGGGALAKSGVGATQALNAPLQGGQLAKRASTQVGEAAAGLAPRAPGATQWAEVVQPAALAAPQAAQSAAGAGAAPYAAGAGLGAAALLAGSTNPNAVQPPAPQAAPQASPQVTTPEARKAVGLFPYSSPDAGKNIYAGVGFGKGGEQQAAGETNDAQRIDSLVSQIPGNGGAPAPAADGSQGGWRDTELGRNVYNTMMALPGVGGLGRIAATGGAISTGLNAASTGINAASRTAALGAGVTAHGFAPAAASTPAATPDANPYANVTPEQGRAMAEINAKAQLQPNGQPQEGRDMGDDITRIDRPGHSPLFTDNKDPDMARFLARPAGGPTKEVSDIMQRMSDKSRNEALRGFQREANAAQYAREVRQAQLNNAASLQQDRASQNRIDQERYLRKLEVAASSRFGSPMERLTAQKAYNAALEQDAGFRAGADAGSVERTKNEGSSARERMQQTGATERAQAQEAGTNARFDQTQGLAQQKFGMEREAQGFQTRAAAQQEQLRNVLLDPNATPEQKDAARQSIQLFSGSSEQWKAIATSGGKDEFGNTLPGGAMLYNPATGDSRPAGGQQQGGAQPLPPGMKRQVGTSNGRPVYEDMNGKQVIAKG